MHIEKIPEHTASHPSILAYTIEPPNSRSLGLSKLLSNTLDVIGGDDAPLGYSTTASLLERESFAFNRHNGLSIGIESGGTQSLENIIATKLLLELICNDIVPSKLQNKVAQIITTHVPNFRNTIQSGINNGFSAAAVQLLPHLAQAVNPPSNRDIATNSSVEAVMQYSGGRGNLPIKDIVDIAKDATRARYGNRQMVAHIDASCDSASRNDIYALVDQTIKVGIMPKLIGPSQLVSDILTGQKTNLIWNPKDLSKLSDRVLDEASNGRVNNLAAICERELRVEDPVLTIINVLEKTGLMNPRTFIRAINTFLPWSEKDNKITISQFENTISRIRNHKI